MHLVFTRMHDSYNVHIFLLLLFLKPRLSLIRSLLLAWLDITNIHPYTFYHLALFSRIVFNINYYNVTLLQRKSFLVKKPSRKGRLSYSFPCRKVQVSSIRKLNGKMLCLCLEPVETSTTSILTWLDIHSIDQHIFYDLALFSCIVFSKKYYDVI